MSLQSDFTVSEFQKPEPKRFEADIAHLMKMAEEDRMQFMRKVHSREMMMTVIGILIVVLGGSGFGWFLLVKADVLRALLCIVAAIIVPQFLHPWARGPLNAYIRNHKENFMPQMAKALGGLSFYPNRGIGEKVLRKTGILPPYQRYTAEDCFMGMYKGVKVIFSEARLYGKKKDKTVFQGVFALLETPAHMFDGLTIVSADKRLVEIYAPTKWKKLQPINIESGNLAHERFQVFSSNPGSAKLLVGEKLLKEFSEAANIFDNAALSAVFFGGKYLFIAIPYDKDMFEASNIHTPVLTKKHANTCQKEIEQLIEIVDVFDIYGKGASVNEDAS